MTVEIIIIKKKNGCFFWQRNTAHLSELNPRVYHTTTERELEPYFKNQQTWPLAQPECFAKYVAVAFRSWDFQEWGWRSKQKKPLGKTGRELRVTPGGTFTKVLGGFYSLVPANRLWETGSELT